MELSRAFDARIARHLDQSAALPQIHCFYEVLSENARHPGLIAATSSMRRAGHPVRVWSYSPQKLEFLAPLGAELRSAEDVIPRTLYEQILAGSEIRYFSDIFRYAVLHEHGGLWMDSDVVLLRPFPFGGEHFFNLQWRGGDAGHFICGNVMYARPRSRHIEALYRLSMDIFASRRRAFGDIDRAPLALHCVRYWRRSPRLGVQSGLIQFDRLDGDRAFQTAAFTAFRVSEQRPRVGIHLWNCETELSHGIELVAHRIAIASSAEAAGLQSGRLSEATSGEASVSGQPCICRRHTL